MRADGSSTPPAQTQADTQLPGWGQGGSQGAGSVCGCPEHVMGQEDMRKAVLVSFGLTHPTDKAAQNSRHLSPHSLEPEV